MFKERIHRWFDRRRRIHQGLDLYVAVMCVCVCVCVYEREREIYIEYKENNIIEKSVENHLLKMIPNDTFKQWITRNSDLKANDG